MNQIKKEHPFWTSIFEQAKEMEKQQMEISDEYIDERNCIMSWNF